MRKIPVCLMPESWRTIFESLRHVDTRVHSLGNFWAAIQEAERQVQDADAGQIRIVIDDSIPDGEVRFVDSKGETTRIINFGRDPA